MKLSAAKATLPPLLNGKWIPITEAISAQVVEMQKRDYRPVFSVISNSGSMDTYAQMSLATDRAITAEIQSNNFSDNQLSIREIQVLRVLGWQLPNDDNPNFWRRVPLDWDSRWLANNIVESLERINRLKPCSWFSFGSDSFGTALARSGAFWIHPKNDNLICLPGQNQGLAQVPAGSRC
jgi:hypothetical protein